MLFEAREVTKHFGGLVAVRSLSFGVREGEILGIFGSNGSGKTTTLNLAAGMIAPTRGAFRWKGDDVTGRKPHQIARLGIVKTFQNPQLFPELSVRGHLRIAGHLRNLRLRSAGGWARRLFGAGARADDEVRSIAKVLDWCRLAEVADLPALALSYGAEKMLGVAMALMCEPQLLLLDEPASGLGQVEVSNLDSVLRDLREHGVTLCIIDHQVGFLGGLADRAIALREGVKIAEGDVATVLRDPAVVESYLGSAHA